MKQTLDAVAGSTALAALSCLASRSREMQAKLIRSAYACGRGALFSSLDIRRQGSMT
ncbi:hypothetical protein [Falsiroseomonas sp. HW251]|uniref:hypothetical protein n=1 Tax=Falsiroseomonas sp. HW251 TaxID=3390998 RepID=UPI003D31A828